MIDKAEEKIEEHALYGNIVNFKHQLDINRQLMDLTNPVLTEEAVAEIEELIVTSPYKYNRTEFLIDDCNTTRHTFGTNNETIEIDCLIKKGIILKFLPKNFEPEFDGDSIEWKSTFIYPPKLNLNENEYDDWVIHILSNWKELYKEIADKYYFDKIVYWKLESSHNVIIERNKTFISNILPILKNTWKQVNYYRNNIDELDKLREIIIRRSKYKKFNTKIEINNNLVTEKKLFLYLENNLNISKNKNTIKNNDYCDFLD
jgi:hypothetical protein